MKKATSIDTPVEAISTTALPPIKVCMHVLRRARTDYRAMRTASTLIKAGFAVSIVDVECGTKLPHEEHSGGISLKHMIIPNWYTSRSFQPWFFVTAVRTFMLSICRLFHSQADIYHAVELTALPACYVVAKVRRKPLIFEAYELHIPVPETDVKFWRLLGPLLLRLLATILPRCAGVITTTPDLLRQYLGLSSGTRIALYQGGLQRNRGLDKLVRAAAFLEPGIVIVLMGEGMGTFQKQLEVLIASEGVADRVKIIPPVPSYEEFLNWTASADIGLIAYTPSYSLAVKLILPNKLFEYIMAGVPVLATELDSIIEVIRTYDVGQISSSAAPADIGAAINEMLADPVALDRMHTNALRAAREDLHWEKESQQLIHLYNHILYHNETLSAPPGKHSRQMSAETSG